MRGTLILVSCTKKKRPGLFLAKDLYASPWFSVARKYAEKRGTEWRILSAKHHLVHPNTELGTYEAEMPTSLSGRTEWASVVMVDILKSFPAQAWQITILAGKRYRLPLVQMLRACEYIVDEPLAHMGIGKQTAWLSQQLIWMAR